MLRSSQYPELLVASYNNNEDAPHEPDGVALVWNLKYKKSTPEYIFQCQVSKSLRGFPRVRVTARADANTFTSSAFGSSSSPR